MLFPYVILLGSLIHIMHPLAGGPGVRGKPKLLRIVLQLTVAGIRSMAEANRAERHAWVERAAQRAEPRAAQSNQDFRVTKKAMRVPAG